MTDDPIKDTVRWATTAFSAAVDKVLTEHLCFCPQIVELLSRSGDRCVVIELNDGRKYRVQLDVQRDPDFLCDKLQYRVWTVKYR